MDNFGPSNKPTLRLRPILRGKVTTFTAYRKIFPYKSANMKIE